MVLAVIRAEIESRTLPCPAGEKFEEFRLEDAVLVVALFGPRIRKQDPDFRKRDAWRKGFDKLPGFGADEVAMGEFGTVGLPASAVDTLIDHVHAEAEFLRKFDGVTCQKVTMTTADFQNDGGLGWQQGGQFRAQRSAALGDVFDEFRFETHSPPIGGEKGQTPSAKSQTEGDKGDPTAESIPDAAGFFFGSLCLESGPLAFVISLAQTFRRRGRRTKMVSPAPSRFSAHTSPPWSWATCFTMLSPSPVPPVSRERPFSTR